ncbi:DUF1572 domain-containing protein [Flavobacteriaceae bacterium S0825]|uniref:DUF1572 family protein n=1 Tax=Gaetbulibacter sp. S0825 TaxID=2720084 RepID=UPI001431631D|nr:DUF1572 family protein [Gaetbulibacter sp. S0825]MCK0109871.1 DUF1572 domain-containing protein [Flavobacteriaceae bacterium S0825]NIX65500.1 DUF1572 family protein [Gaetbulibacter sp. S0825]
MTNSYLSSIIKQFEYYKSLGDKTFEQLSNEHIHWQYNNESNSVAIIVKHIVGNMLSRWTNFLTEDGEKIWRERDKEFIDTYNYKEDMLMDWNKGWECLFEAIKPLEENQLEQIIYIRNQGHTVTEAINRQLAHYSYHIGQIVFLGKMITNNHWKPLSIPKGKSSSYNQEKFAKDKGRRHFTDDL